MHRPIDHEMNHPFHCLCSGARCAAADRFNRHLLLLLVVVVVVVTAAAVVAVLESYGTVREFVSGTCRPFFHL